MFVILLNNVLLIPITVLLQIDLIFILPLFLNNNDCFSNHGLKIS